MILFNFPVSVVAVTYSVWETSGVLYYAVS